MSTHWTERIHHMSTEEVRKYMELARRQARREDEQEFRTRSILAAMRGDEGGNIRASADIIRVQLARSGTNYDDVE